MIEIKFAHSPSRVLQWDYGHSSVSALRAILSLTECKGIDNQKQCYVFPTDNNGLKQANDAAYMLADEISDWMGVLAELGRVHLERFDDPDFKRSPSREDTDLSRRVFVTLESIRELHSMIHEFIGIAEGSIGEMSDKNGGNE